MMRKQNQSCSTAVGSWAEKQKVLGLSVINVVRRTQRVVTPEPADAQTLVFGPLAALICLHTRLKGLT